jgi:hypothetical protein
MVISQIASHEVVVLARQAVALPLTTQELRDEALLAALLRRAASIYCPCSPSTLVNAVFEHLRGITTAEEELRKDIEAAVDSALVSGDLLELNQATTDDPNVKSTWVFAASPAFIARRSGSVFITGVASDDPTPLPVTFKSRIVYDRHLRKIQAEQGEDLPQVLRGFGLIELTMGNWLRSPREEAPKEHYDRLLMRLNGQAASGDIPDLEILDPAKDPSYYRGRWTQPRHSSGVFVARRPQAYGAALWCLVLLSEGIAQKFLDFPLSNRFRGADCAWQAQMAIDACNGTPQTYRKRLSGEDVLFDFFSPLPLWAERRLAIIGQTAPRDHCLISYSVPSSEVAAEEQFLQTNLWLSSRETQEQR